MASIACRMAGDASSNFNATLMVQALIFDTSLSILELTPNKSFGVISSARHKLAIRVDYVQNEDVQETGPLCVAGNDLTPAAARAIGLDDIGHVTLPLERWCKSAMNMALAPKSIALSIKRVMSTKLNLSAAVQSRPMLQCQKETLRWGKRRVSHLSTGFLGRSRVLINWRMPSRCFSSERHQQKLLGEMIHFQERH